MKQVGVQTNIKAGVTGAVGAYTPTAVTPAPPSGTSALVSGAGTARVNGNYTPRGTNDGKLYFNLEGQPDMFGQQSIYWNSGASQWFITDVDQFALYLSGDAVALPWLVTTWQLGEEGGPELPVPVVTQG